MKRWFDPFKTALTGVITHKLRSFLTILGIVIGVAAVIALMSVGKGAEQTILSSISNLGSDLITIRPGASFEGGVMKSIAGVQTLTLEDAEAIVLEIPNVKAVAPSSSTGAHI